MLHCPSTPVYTSCSGACSTGWRVASQTQTKEDDYDNPTSIRKNRLQGACEETTLAEKQGHTRHSRRGEDWLRNGVCAMIYNTLRVVRDFLTHCLRMMEQERMTEARAAIADGCR